ncbi:MAG TPA: aminotransferase class I/II-fold pyridoxal phosphate-dependent enzyme [Gemmatimonadales bacterium]|nr:aminotransferase class I/II-fold pyridoxal phosphate-dependent enzyme [Gemmatimonadales bacterium]
MQPEDFRRHGHQLVDWMADYMQNVGELPVTPAVQPGAILRRLPSSAPVQGEAFERLLQDFTDIIVPGMTHWNHPGWFAYFPGNNSPPSVLAEMLTATLGAQCMSWATSPAATELEQVTMEWLRGMLGLPGEFSGVIQDTASTATLVALLSARERATNHSAGRKGLAGSHQRLTVYASSEAHSSVDKGVKLAGYGLEQLRRVPVDERFAMQADALDAIITGDKRAGLTPACVVATVGTTSSTAIDPLDRIAEVCSRHGVWLHVDAAYGGTAAIVPELRHYFAGVENADSFVFNPHKWMLVNFDCSAYFVRDRDTLLRTFQVSPEYLRTSHDAEVVNYRDWGIQLGRRFRALKLWFVIRCYGVAGLQALVRKHVSLAAEMASWIESSRDFELMAPVPLGLLCFRYHPPELGDDEAILDELNARLLARVNASRRVHLTHTRLDGRYVIRVVVGQRQTERVHVEEVWSLLQETARALPTPRVPR